jgi:hypothetical protein
MAGDIIRIQERFMTMLARFMNIERVILLAIIKTRHIGGSGAR